MTEMYANFPQSITKKCDIVHTFLIIQRTGHIDIYRSIFCKNQYFYQQQTGSFEKTYKKN